MKEFWSSRIRGLTPYTPGEQPRERKFIKLNTNENPYPPSPMALSAIRAAADEPLRLYPDPDCTQLREVMAATCGLKPSQVFVGNGSDEVLALCFQAFFDPDRILLFPDVTYSFYPVFAALYGLQYRQVPLDEGFGVPVESFLAPNGGVVLANPNAPTGRALSLCAIRRILEGNPGAVVLVDEAYVDFGAESAVELIDRYPNLVVVQTLSKSRSLAGLRVGFALAQENLIAALNCVKNSFNSYPLDRLALAGRKAPCGIRTISAPPPLRSSPPVTVPRPGSRHWASTCASLRPISFSSPIRRRLPRSCWMACGSGAFWCAGGISPASGTISG